MMTDELNDLAQRLRALSRHEHDDLSIGDEAADAIRALIDERDAAFAMSGCECGADEACAQLVALHAEIERLRADARRYQWLRKRHWHDSPLAVVRAPRHAVKPGRDCPSEYRLDEAIDAAQQEQEK